MKLKISIAVLFLFVSSNILAQDLNAYKYVLVPKKFDFQKSEDQYQANSLTKFLFSKKGFKVLHGNEKLPDDLVNNPCLGLKAKVLENSNMFTTKLAIELSDCRNTVVLTSEEGKSKIKDFKKGHHDALRKAFQSIQIVDYTYDRSVVNHPKKEEIRKVAVAEIPIAITKEAAEAEQKTKTEVDKIQDDIKVEDKLTTEVAEDDLHILYAQKIENGFQLVDSTPKIVYKLLKTSIKDVYLLENQSGIAYKKDGNWFAEFYFEGKLVRKQLTIKF